jgi:hypothetical protein
MGSIGFEAFLRWAVGISMNTPTGPYFRCFDFLGKTKFKGGGQFPVAARR